MGREQSGGPTIRDIFSSKKTQEILDILKSKSEPSLSSIRGQARSLLQEARIPAKAVAWHEIRKEGATMKHKKMWAGIYGNSVREEMFASQVIGLVKVVKRDSVTDLVQEKKAKRRIRSFMKNIGSDKMEAGKLADRSMSFSKRIQRSVGAQEDVSLYEKPRTRKKRTSPSQ